MNVGLFFGTFNPIHNGHINIAQDILDSGEVDEIWMVLSPKSPDKNLILDVFSRYSLMQIALDNMHNIEISKSVKDSLINAIHKGPQNDRIVVFGSFYIVAEAILFLEDLS